MRIKGKTQSGKGEMLKQHPFNILENASRRLWILLFPLIRGLLSVGLDLYSWVQGAWFDILVIIVLISFAVYRWRYVKFMLTQEGIYFERGFIARSSSTIPYSQITSVSIEQPFLHRMLGVARVRAETMAGARRSADLRLTISNSYAVKLEESLHSRCFDIKDREATNRAYSPAKHHLVLFSLMSSSTLSGALFVSALVSQAGAILGKKLDQELFDTLADVSSTLHVGLPPIAIAVSAVFMIGWLAGFISSILRHMRFHLVRRGRHLLINAGVLTHRSYMLDTRHVTYVDFRQTLLTRLFSIASVYVRCTGYGKGKNEINVLVPATSATEAYSTAKLLLPEFKRSRITLRPRLIGIGRYVGMPLVLFVGLAAIYAFWIPTLMQWGQLLKFFVGMAMLPSAWWLLACIVAFSTTGMACNEGMLTIRYAAGFRFHTAILPLSEIAKLETRQSILSRAGKSCDVIIYSVGEGRKRHITKAMPTKAALDMIRFGGATV